MNDLTKKLSRLWMFVPVPRRKIYLAWSMMIIGSAFLVLIPYVIGKILDYSMDSNSGSFTISDDKLYLALLVIAIFLLIWFFMNHFGKKMIYENIKAGTIRNTLAEKTTRLPVSYLEGHDDGDITALVSNDVPTVHRMMTVDIPGMITQTAMIIAILILMVLSNVWLALVYIILMVVSTYITHLIDRSVSADLKNQAKSLGMMNGFFSAVIHNHTFIKIYNLERTVENKFKRINVEHNDSYVRTVSVYGYVGPVSRIVDNIGYFVSAVLGAAMIANQQIQMGMFTSFISYATLIGGPIVSYAVYYNHIHSGMASYGRIFEYLDEEELSDDSSYPSLDAEEVRGDLVFDEVSFGYVPDNPVLSNVSFDIRTGSSVAIVGTGGSGKSTLSDLLMGFHVPDSGEIMLDGRDITEIKRSDFRKVVGISRQHPWIFDGTIADNLSLTASRERIIEISKMTGLDEFIFGMPDGYDTVIGECGHIIPPGIMQMLAVTRLVLHDPKIMIFDEATSDLDPITRDRLFKGIQDILAERTVITITNVASLVLNSDLVLMLDSGHIVDYGTHSELMERAPAYAELFRNMTF